MFSKIRNAFSSSAGSAEHHLTGSAGSTGTSGSASASANTPASTHASTSGTSSSKRTRSNTAPISSSSSHHSNARRPAHSSMAPPLPVAVQPVIDTYATTAQSPSNAPTALPALKPATSREPVPSPSPSLLSPGAASIQPPLGTADSTRSFASALSSHSSSAASAVSSNSSSPSQYGSAHSAASRSRQTTLHSPLTPPAAVDGSPILDIRVTKASAESGGEKAAATPSASASDGQALQPHTRTRTQKRVSSLPPSPVPLQDSTFSPAPSDNTNTPLSTPRLQHFPVPATPFSTPATPPRARLSPETSKNSPVHAYVHTSGASAANVRDSLLRSSTGPSSSSHHPNTNSNIKASAGTTQQQQRLHRKKTKSTSTLPGWLVASFSSNKDREAMPTSTPSGPLLPRRASAAKPSLTAASAAVPLPSRLETRRGSLPMLSPSLDARPASELRQPLGPVGRSASASAAANAPSGASSGSQSQLDSSAPSTPRTPIQASAPSSMHAPSPLLGPNSPYHIVDLPSDQHAGLASSSNTPRRLSTAGSKKRNFTEVLLGNGSSRHGGGDGHTKSESKSRWKGKKNATTAPNAGSGDYSSLISASKRAFSKSVDDLTSFTKQSLLASPINYSRPRKSVDERRVYMYHPATARVPSGSSGMQEDESESLSSSSSVSVLQEGMTEDTTTTTTAAAGDRSSTRRTSPVHVFKVPKLPNDSPKPRARKSEPTHRKAASSAQVQLPPSSSLPVGLCIESTANILASSMDAIDEPEESNASARPGTSIKRKSLGSPANISPPLGLAPPLLLSPGKISSNGTTAKRPTLSSRKSSGSKSISSIASSVVTVAASPKQRRQSTMALSSQQRASAAHQRASQITLMEGLLQRKTDHRSHAKATSWAFPFMSSSMSTSSSSVSPGSSPSSASWNVTTRNKGLHTPPLPASREIDLTKGWKPFYAIFRGTSLYLYKLPSEMQVYAKGSFASYTNSRSALSASTSSSATLTSRSKTPGAIVCIPATNPWSASHEAKVKLYLGSIVSGAAKPAYVLPVASSTVESDITANALDVFQIVTEEGEVAILQALGEGEAEKWSQCLRRAGMDIATKRASYVETHPPCEVSPGTGARRPETIYELSTGRVSSATARDGTLGRAQTTKAFGLPLEDLLESSSGTVPDLLENLLQAVEAKGLLEAGIYRIPGENRVLQTMQAKLDAGAHVDIFNDPAFGDPHNLASLTKLWLRSLPEIIAPRFYLSFIEANAITDYEARLFAIRDLVWTLPTPFFNLLNRLCEHLHLIAEHEMDNQMHASNLAIVFAPTILRPPEGEDSYTLLMLNLGNAAKLVASLIVQHHWIFSGDEADENDIQQTADSAIGLDSDPSAVAPLSTEKEDIKTDNNESAEKAVTDQDS